MSEELALEEIKRRLERLQKTLEAVCKKFGIPVPEEE